MAASPWSPNIGAILQKVYTSAAEEKEESKTATKAKKKKSLGKKDITEGKDRITGKATPQASPAHRYKAIPISKRKAQGGRAIANLKPRKSALGEIGRITSLIQESGPVGMKGKFTRLGIYGGHNRPRRTGGRAIGAKSQNRYQKGGAGPGQRKSSVSEQTDTMLRREKRMYR